MNDGWINRSRFTGREVFDKAGMMMKERGRRVRLVGWVGLLGESMSDCCCEPGLLLETTCLAGARRKRRERSS